MTAFNLKKLEKNQKNFKHASFSVVPSGALLSNGGIVLIIILFIFMTGSLNLQIRVYTGAGILKLLRSPGIDSASLCSLAGRYDNPIPNRFLAPIDCYKTQAQHTICTIFYIWQYAEAFARES